jgi:hypothetical protein
MKLPSRPRRWWWTKRRIPDLGCRVRRCGTELQRHGGAADFGHGDFFAETRSEDGIWSSPTTLPAVPQRRGDSTAPGPRGSRYAMRPATDAGGQTVALREVEDEVRAKRRGYLVKRAIEGVWSPRFFSSPRSSAVLNPDSPVRVGSDKPVVASSGLPGCLPDRPGPTDHGSPASQVRFGASLAKAGTGS